MAREYRKGAKEGKKVELHFTMISPPERQVGKPYATSVNESVSTFKRGHRMLESLNLKMLVTEGGFEVELYLINSPNKGLVYLKGQVNAINVSLFIDTGVTQFFMTSVYARILKAEVKDTALPVKMNFAQRSCQAAQGLRTVRFKADNMKFEEDFTICELGGVDLVLKNIFLHSYEIKVIQRPNVHIVMVGSDGKLKSLPFTRLAGLDGLGINLVSKQDLFEE